MHRHPDDVEFRKRIMPPLDEGSILFMPVTMPDASNSEIKRILQIQDKDHKKCSGSFKMF